MKLDGLVLLLLAAIFLLMHIAGQWKKKADKWDEHIGNKHDENWVPNVSEMLNEERFMKYKRRIDYVFISAASFYEWVIRRYNQIKIFAKE